jgi:hypothetical protein
MKEVRALLASAVLSPLLIYSLIPLRLKLAARSSTSFSFIHIYCLATDES